MESSLHLRDICFILQNISLFPVLVTTVLRNHSLGILIVRQNIFIPTKLKGEIKHLLCNWKRIMESSLHLC